MNNNYDNQNNYGDQGRDPLPQYNGYQTPNGNYYNQEPNAYYNYQQVPQVNPAYQAEVDDCVNSAFSKGLAAAIMSEFPIASIIAIFMGAAGGSSAKRAAELGELYGIKVSGKNVAGRILSKVGMIVGIVFSAFWALYFFLIVFAFMMGGF